LYYEELKCSTLPDKYIRQPLLILETLTTSGSVFAKMIYLSHTIEFIDTYKKLDLENKDYLMNVLNQAEKFGFEAALGGSSESNYLMAEAYSTGLFGRKDLMKSLSFLLPLEKTSKRNGLNFTINEITHQLSAEEIKTSHELALGCVKNDGSSNMNPFG
jgi:hypothetical protein